MMRVWLVMSTVVSTLAGAANAGDPVEGMWKTEVDDGSYAYVVMGPCGTAYCGTISRTFNASGEYASANLGQTLVIDMVAKGEGRYEGQVWRPSNDKVYLGKMDLTGDALKLRGCVAGGLICSKQTWTRVK